MNGLEDRLNQARSEEDFGTISQGSFWDSHPVLSGLGNMVKELTGIAPSQRLWGQTFGPKSPLRSEMLKPKTPYEMADYAAGVTANTLETALAGVDMAAVAGIKNAAGRTITDLLRGEAGVIGNIKKPGQSLSGTGTELRPAIMVKDTGEVFTGNTHGDAFNKALSEGAITKDTPSENIFSDFFQTKDGELIDRFEASQKYGVTSAEDIQKQSLRGSGAEVLSEQDQLIKEMSETPRWKQLGLDAPRNQKDMLTPKEELSELWTGPRTPKVEPIYAIGDIEAQRVLISDFKQNLGPQGRNFLNRLKDNGGTSALHINSKTGTSLDFSTACPYIMNPCPYCYVTNGRLANELFNMKVGVKNIFESPYRREIMAAPQEIVNLWNSQGGLRAHSFGDYRPLLDYDNWKLALDDAEAKGAYIKAITKVPEFVHSWGSHPNLRINISIDDLPREMSNAPTLNHALQLKAGRENIKVRSVALTEEQGWAQASNPDVNVVTLYHGLVGDKLRDIIRAQNPNLLKKIGEPAMWKETDKWQDMSRRSNAFKRLAKEFPEKICCQSGKCAGDPTKCGFGLSAAGGIIAGVMLPEIDEGEN